MWISGEKFWEIRWKDRSCMALLGLHKMWQRPLNAHPKPQLLCYIPQPLAARQDYMNSFDQRNVRGSVVCHFQVHRRQKSHMWFSGLSFPHWYLWSRECSYKVVEPPPAWVTTEWLHGAEPPLTILCDKCHELSHQLVAPWRDSQALSATETYYLQLLRFGGWSSPQHNLAHLAWYRRTWLWLCVNRIHCSFENYKRHCLVFIFW